MSMKTIRCNALKKILSLLAECALVTCYKYDEMDSGAARDAVTASDVMESGQKSGGFDRVYADYDGNDELLKISVGIHANYFFTGYRTKDAAKAALTPEAFAKYFPADVTRPEPEAVAPIEAEPIQNHYEAKQAERKARYEARAAQASTASDMTYKRARSMASVIPFGQPIHIGHHSERSDRNYRGKIHNTFGKAFALADTAKHYADKAESVGTGGISSDDPDAVSKLSIQLVKMEEEQAMMKKVNALVRKKDVKGIEALGFSPEAAANLLTKDFAGRIGYPSYRLTNNNANIKRVKDRIAALQKLAERVSVEQAGAGYTYKEDTDENRVMFIFEGKPDEQTRKILKNNAFKWSPNREGKPWVRQLTNAGLWAGKQVREALNKLALQASEVA